MTTVAFLYAELRVQRAEMFLLQMLELVAQGISPDLMVLSLSALSSGYLIKGRSTLGMSADCI